MPAATPSIRRGFLTRRAYTEYSYRLQICGNDENCHYVIRTRYSQVQKLHSQLAKSVPGLPAIPPKSWRNRLKSSTVEARQRAFATFFAHALVRCERANSIAPASSLRKFVCENSTAHSDETGAIVLSRQLGLNPMNEQVVAGPIRCDMRSRKQCSKHSEARCQEAEQ